MSGQEADTWVELKRKLFATLARAEQGIIAELTDEDRAVLEGAGPGKVEQTY